MSAGASDLADSPVSGTELDGIWWAPALALHERRTEPLPRWDGTAAPGSDLDRWRAANGAGLAERLADLGLDENLLVGLLVESPACLAARIPQPEWARSVERAVRSVAPAGELPARPPGQWQDAFALPLRPLVADASARLVEAAGRVLDPAEVDLDGVARSFDTGLSRRLVAIAARTFVAHLHEMRTAGALTGADSRARFDDFVTGLARPGGLAALFTRYPVLARLLGQTCDFAADAQLELLTRFAADRAAVVATLLGEVDPGPVRTVVAGLGDAHRQGRSVSMVGFADGRRVVYRPRDTGTHGRFAELVRLLNETLPRLGLRSVAVVARPGYGWLEHVAHRPMTDQHEVDRFYRRQGALLALLHVVDGSDIHCENLIACGDHPVLIDVETMFHPDLVPAGRPRDDPAAQAFGASVHRTALLPFPVVGEHGVLDISGLGGGAGGMTPRDVVDWDFAGTDRMRLARRPAPFTGAENRPRLAGHDIDPADHEPALQEGFRLAYNAIVLRRDDFAAYLESCADVEVRVVVRPTERYAFLLDESTHPALLRDALDRDLTLDELWRQSTHDPLLRRLVRHELTDLWDGQVPLFTAMAGARDLVASDGRLIHELLERTGVRQALHKLRDMCEADRCTQAWIISAALATRRRMGSPAGTRAEEHQDVESVPGPVTSTGAHPQRLLVAACAIADQLVARSLASPSRVNWLGLELVDRRQWAVLPMGGGLADGYLGVALFLAQLWEISGIARYADTARAAVAAVPDLLDLLTERADLVALVGRGGLRGLGGLAYGLARLASLLDDAAIREWARTAVDLAAGAPDRPGWVDGSAGCLAAMSAVHTELGLDSAGRLAVECAEHTAAHVSRAPSTVPAGFADGWAGIAWALARCAPAGDPRYAAAARLALDRLPSEDAVAGTPGWCQGAAGLVLARSGVAGLSPRRAANTLLSRPVLRDLSLCHGELGVIEAITALADSTGDPTIVAAGRRRAGLVLGAVDRYGLSCGTPGWVSTPGLLSGWAGIGYGMLRLGFAQRVPSVLLLQPSRVREVEYHHAGQPVDRGGDVRGRGPARSGRDDDRHDDRDDRDAGRDLRRA
jgi:type 2 lantibiotic biosynthesis protein LanM